MTRTWLLFLAVAGGCASDHIDADRSYLEPDQGVCTDLDVDGCKADDRCQQAYVDSAFSPGPTPMSCLEVLANGPITESCNGLGHEVCRSESACSPVYEQDLGPNDGPVGDPYFTRCVDATTIFD